jgi:AAA15 family ATPase/GTPase
VEIKDFLVFKGEFAVDFCPGVNVIIGGNATGKTTLMKVMYFPFILAHEKIYKMPGFLDSVTTRRIAGYGYTKDTQGKIIFDDVEYFFFGSAPMASCSSLDKVQAIFIPVIEMLSHSKGFLELNSKYEMPFDQIQVDILINAGLPETREISPLCAALLEKIGKIIDGEVLYENGKYYIIKKSGLKVEFSLEASGFQKFGLLWKLLRNGLLEKGSVLFWDEPEASLNPELMSGLVDILLELQRNGVQIFVATHSEILARNFAVARKDNNEVMFCALYKDGEQVKVETNDRFDLLEHNKLTDARVNVYHKELERGLDND